MPAITITAVGNVARDPETKTTSGGPLCTFTVASTERYRGDNGEWKDGDVSWLRCVAWGALGERIAETFTKGARVIVTGRLQEREYEQNGTKRRAWEVVVSDAGQSLKFAQAPAKATAKATLGGTPPSEDDPWADDGDRPPF